LTIQALARLRLRGGRVAHTRTLRSQGDSSGRSNCCVGAANTKFGVMIRRWRDWICRERCVEAFAIGGIGVVGPGIEGMIVMMRIVLVIAVIDMEVIVMAITCR
jgi:hypothetical protein